MLPLLNGNVRGQIHECSVGAKKYLDCRQSIHVPKQHSTGGKQAYGRISKKGNTDLRVNLVQGARTVLMGGLKKRKNKNPFSSSLMEWALRCYDRKGMNKAAVAVANKISRIAWKILKTNGMTFVSATPVMPVGGEADELDKAIKS